MAVTGFAGLEVGLFAEIIGVYGSAEISTVQKHTGAYSMLLDLSLDWGYIQLVSGSQTRISTWIYLASSPSTEMSCLGDFSEVGWNLKLTATRTVNLYEGTSKRVTGTTAIGLEGWHRISLTVNSTDGHAYYWIDGVAEGDFNGISTYTQTSLGFGGTVTVVAYFDDAICDNASDSTSELEDLRGATIAHPNGAGAYSNFDTVVPSGAHYATYDDPAGTAVTVMDDDYVQQASAISATDCATLESSSEIGLVSTDTIRYVMFIVYAEGVSQCGLYTYEGGNSGSNNIIRAKGWYYKIESLSPTNETWTQTHFNATGMGIYCGANETDSFLYAAFALVLFTPQTFFATLTAVQHDTHIDLTWS